jgi:hypothetical protein
MRPELREMGRVEREGRCERWGVTGRDILITSESRICGRSGMRFSDPVAETTTVSVQEVREFVKAEG